MPLVFLHCPLRHATIEFFGIGVEVPPNSSMIISDVLDVNASDGCWDLHSHLLEVEVAILSGVPLGLAPHTLDEVELAVVFWIKIGNVPCVLHGDGEIVPLLEKVWLVGQHPACTTRSVALWAAFALKAKVSCPQAPFNENLLCSLWKPVLPLHLLLHPAPVLHEPPVAHLGLLPPLRQVHRARSQGVHGQSAVIAALIEQPKPLTPGMHGLEGRNGFFELGLFHFIYFSFLF